MSVLAAVGVVESSNDIKGAFAGLDRFYGMDGLYRNGLIELGTLNMLSSFVLPPSAGRLYRDGEAVVRMIGGSSPQGIDACFGLSTLLKRGPCSSQVGAVLVATARSTWLEGTPINVCTLIPPGASAPKMLSIGRQCSATRAMGRCETAGSTTFSTTASRAGEPARTVGRGARC